MYVVSRASNGVLTALCVAMTCPPAATLVTSSRRVHLGNLALCYLHHVHFSIEIWKEFNVTYTESQMMQIMQMQIGSICGLSFIGTISLIYKAIETDLWKLAQSNSERADRIHKEVLDAVEAKDNFAASLSHEIRNPLNAMKGSIDYLLGVVKDHAHLKILEHAHLSSEVLLTLLNNVLDAAKLRSDKVELDFAEANLLDIVRKIAIIFSDRLREKQLRAQIMINKSIPPNLWIDSSRVLQIIINLFSNSLKFTPMHGKIFLKATWCTERALLAPEELLTPIEDMLNHRILEPKRSAQVTSLHEALENSIISNGIITESMSLIECSPSEVAFRRNNFLEKNFESKSLSQILNKNSEMSRKYLIWNIKGTNSTDFQQINDNLSPLTPQERTRNGFLKVQISDTGSGIEPEHISGLFGRFNQAGKGISSVHGGSGLGLWITKQLCQKMGGDIKVYSQVNQGTTMVFYIPVYNENIDSPLPQERSLVQEKKIRALVVDDYAYNRDIHKLLLEREGVQVNVASNGREAVEKYTRQSNGYYDLIMMDVQMPEMNGFCAAKGIREWEEMYGWEKTNIYLISGEYFNESDIMDELKKEGRIGNTTGIRCLRKPIDIDVIRTVVKKNKLK